MKVRPGPMRTTTLNYLLYQVGWLAAIGGTAAGHEGVGVAVPVFV